MFKLLFLTHTGTGQPPAALFIARQLIQDADLEDRIEAESARIEDCKGEPLCEEGKNALEAAGFPVTHEVPIPLEWKTYDNYNLILLVDNPDNPALFNTMGGDVDNKIHLLSEYAGFEGDIENPYEEGTFAGAIKASEAACKGLIDQLSSWMK